MLIQKADSLYKILINKTISSRNVNCHIKIKKKIQIEEFQITIITTNNN